MADERRQDKLITTFMMVPRALHIWLREEFQNNFKRNPNLQLQYQSHGVGQNDQNCDPYIQLVIAGEKSLVESAKIKLDAWIANRVMEVDIDLEAYKQSNTVDPKKRKHTDDNPDIDGKTHKVQVLTEIREGGTRHIAKVIGHKDDIIQEE